MPAGIPEVGRGFDNTYTFGRQLGSGAYSTVHVCTERKTQQEFAVKVILKKGLPAAESKNLRLEVSLMQESRHSNIVEFVGFYDEPAAFYIVTELMTGGELLERIVKKKHYNEAEARHVVRTVARTLGYCHAHGIVHRDLKPENILLSDNTPEATVKLADFGFAKRLATAKDGGQVANSLWTACGSPSYVAPEILSGKAYGSAVDLWSLGVITYILLCGCEYINRELRDGRRPGLALVAGYCWGVGVDGHFFMLLLLLFSSSLSLKRRPVSLTGLSSTHARCCLRIAAFMSSDPPFFSDSQPKLFAAIKRGSFQMRGERWERVSDGAKAFIRRLLDVNPATRMTAEQAIRHPWLARGSSVALATHLLPEPLDEIRRFNTRRKLRAGFLQVGRVASGRRGALTAPSLTLVISAVVASWGRSHNKAGEPATG